MKLQRLIFPIYCSEISDGKNWVLQRRKAKTSINLKIKNTENYDRGHLLTYKNRVHQLKRTVLPD
jgi:hypothetical protein